MVNGGHKKILICFFFALVVSFYSWMIFNPVEKIAPNLSFFENLQRIRDVGVEISEPVANYSNVTTVNNEESLESDFGKPKTKLKLPKPDTLVEYKSLPWREYISKEDKDGNAIEYIGPIVKGWPPGKDRDMNHYIRPDISNFLIEPNGEKVRSKEVLFAVQSSIGSFDLRETIRSTWAKEAAKANQSVIFVVGRTDELNATNSLKNESKVFGDVLQADFVDDYYNLTLKTVFTLKYFYAMEKRPKYIMKIDDDSYLNVPGLLKVLRKCYPHNADPAVVIKDSDFALDKDRSKFAIGKLFKKSPLIMETAKYNKKTKELNKYTSKWGVPTYFAKAKSNHPAMMSGSGYILSRDAAVCAYKESLKIPFFHLEDVHVNGFAGQNCGRAIFHFGGFDPTGYHAKGPRKYDLLIHYVKQTETFLNLHRMMQKYSYNEDRDADIPCTLKDANKKNKVLKIQ